MTEQLTVARILEIRDALLPAQGEPFDCVAFAVEIVKAERARSTCPQAGWEDDLDATLRARNAEIGRLSELADSEGTRAVENLRRARRAEGELELLRAAAADVVQVWNSPSWNWSHTGSAADAMNALAAALGPNAKVCGRGREE